MHYMGMGAFSKLATSLGSVLAVSKTPFEKPAAAAEEPVPPGWVKMVEDSVGRKGTFKGGVLSYGVPRGESVKLGEMIVAPAAGVGGGHKFPADNTGEVAYNRAFALFG